MGCTLTTEEVAHINRTIADLESENARLRSCLTDADENARQIMGENAKLREQGARLFDKTLELGTENAKLRELVNVFYHCTTSGYCDECPINGGGTVHLQPDTICDTIHDRMRELGVVE